MKFLLNLSSTTRMVLCILLVLTTLLAWYSGWAYYRATWGSHDLVDNVQPFPHPDVLVMQLNDWYDRRHPMPGYIKLRGELNRVRLTLLAVFVPSAVASLALLQLVLAPWIYSPKSRKFK